MFWWEPRLIVGVISQATLNKFQRIQNPLASVIINTSKYQHITPLLKKPHWLTILTKNRLQTQSFHIQNTNQQATYFHNSLSFPPNSVSTRSSDSLVLSILFVRSSLRKSIHSGIHSLLIVPETRVLWQYSVPSSKYTCSKLRSLQALSHLPWLSTWILILDILYFRPYWLTPRETSSDANIPQVDYIPSLLRELRD